MSSTSHESDNLLFFAFGFFLFLFLIIFLNIFIHVYPTNYLLRILKHFSLYINIGLIVITCIFGIPFVIFWRRYFRYRDPIIIKDYTAPELEQKILHIAAKEKGKYISPMTLKKKLRFRGTLEELKFVLQHLRQENKIKFDNENYPYYKVRIPEMIETRTGHDSRRMIERRTGHYSRRNLLYLIFYSLLFVLFLLGLVGFNVFVKISKIRFKYLI